MKKSYLKNRFITPLMIILKQGITPEKLALTVSVGSILAVFPVFGTTTILCVIFAFLFRLNHAAIQIVNYGVYPLWFILLVPFYKIGGMLFRSSVVNLSAEKIITLFRIDKWEFIQSLGLSTLYAIAAWALICPVIAAILYFLTLPVFRKYSKSCADGVGPC